LPTLLTAADWIEIQRVFDAVVELPPDQRPIHLNDFFGSHPHLRSHIESLLEAAGESSHLSAAIGTAAEDALSVGLPCVGDRVGPYLINGILGHGGMGVVYRATRADHEYQKDVAIKVIGFGLVRPEHRQRFLMERQILANLDHPNIARLLDGGTTQSGSPYVVMEYVHGQAIDRHCTEKSLLQRERIRLVIEVARAVEYAHQHLIVHRDLKPDNIFIDSEGSPKLLDFGIAKALGVGEDGMTRGLTQTVERIMTPDYASPEQLLGQPITTSTDVFQLGVLLYVLLTGVPPFRAPSGRIGELENSICNDAPRKTDLPTDIDRIVLQALEKDPRRRYPSAAALAEDLQRHLDGFPVKARASSWRYTTWKFATRHKAAVLTGTIIALGLVGVSIAMTMIARRASEEARIADETTNFLLSIFSANDPEQGRGDQTTARELLDQAAAQLRKSSNQDPVVKVKLLDSIGESYRMVGDTQQGKDLAEEALHIRQTQLPEDKIAMGDTLTRIGDAESDLSNFEKSLQDYRQALQVYTEALGQNDARVAAAKMGIGGNLWELNRLSEAERYQLEAIALESKLKGRHDLDTLNMLNDLALTYDRQGKLVEEEKLFREILSVEQEKLRPSHPQLAFTWTNLGWNLWVQSRFAEAEKALRNALEIRVTAYPDDHWLLASSRTALATVLVERGKAAEALALARRAKQADLKAYGATHKETALAQDALAMALLAEGQPREAQAELDSALESRLKLFPADHPNVVKNLMYLAEIHYAAGELATARKQIDTDLSYVKARGAGGDDKMFVPQMLVVQARILAAQGENAAAQAAALEALREAQRFLPAYVNVFADAEATLGLIYAQEAKAGQGIPLLQDALNLDNRIYGPALPQTAQIAVRLAECLDAAGRTRDADRVAAISGRYLLASPDPSYWRESVWLKHRSAARTHGVQNARLAMKEAQP